MQLAQARERGLNIEGAIRAYTALVDSAPQASEAPLALFRAWKLASEMHDIRAAEFYARLHHAYPFAPEAAIAALVPQYAA